MKAVVTGSMGYIGSHLVHYLRQGGVDVTEIDAIMYFKKGYNLNDQWDKCKPWIEEADVVFHLAAKTPKGKIKGSYWDNNVGVTHRIMETIQPHQRLIAASSCCVYRGDWDHDYRRSKVAMEKIIAGVGLHTKSCTVRFSNVWGRGGNGVIDTWIQRALLGKPLVIYENQYRDFIHVLDVVNVLMYIDAMMRSDAEVPLYVDIATGKSTDIREPLVNIQRYTGDKSFVSTEELDASWGISSPAWLLSHGWKPQYPIETALKDECLLYAKNQSKR